MAGRIQLASQTADHRIQHICAGIETDIPHLVEQCTLGQAMPLVRSDLTFFRLGNGIATKDYLAFDGGPAFGKRSSIHGDGGVVAWSGCTTTACEIGRAHV